MVRKGKELEYISRIDRDGSGVVMKKDFQEGEINVNEDEEFKMNRLSITENTWIASGFNSYVVKIKEEDGRY